MEELQPKVESWRGQKARLTKLHNEMEDIMAQWRDLYGTKNYNLYSRKTIGTKALEVISVGHGHR